jgi:RND family efflux transporter MFP subunit
MLILVVLVGGCTARPPGRPTRTEEERLPRLETEQPQRTDLELTSELTATVDALEKADLCAQVRGVITKMPADIDIGRPIKQGEVLVTLDVPDLVADRDHKAAVKDQQEKLREQAERRRVVAAAEVTEAEAQAKRYQADLDFRELAHRRLTELSKRETVQPQLTEESRLQRDAASSALAAARAQVQTKQARLKAAEGDIDVADSSVKAAAAELAKAQAAVGFASITAPFNGVITKRWVDPGATIKDPGMPVLTVMRTDKVRVIIDVPQRDVPHLHASEPADAARPPTAARLRVPALGDATFDGHVTLVANALDAATRTMRAEIHLDNRAGRLRPQMTGTVRLMLARREKVLTIPSSALVHAGDRMEVYYVDGLAGNPPRGVVKRAEVELGLDDGRRVEIRAGLTGSERVVAKGTGVVRVGESVIATDPRPQ